MGTESAACDQEGGVENVFRYRCGDVPATRRKFSRNAVADPKPASDATCSTDHAVVSRNSCARRTRAASNHCSGDIPVSARKRRLNVRVRVRARCAMASIVNGSFKREEKRELRRLWSSWAAQPKESVGRFPWSASSKMRSSTPNAQPAAGESAPQAARRARPASRCASHSQPHPLRDRGYSPGRRMHIPFVMRLVPPENTNTSF